MPGCKQRIMLSMQMRDKMTIINGCTWMLFFVPGQHWASTGSRPFLYDLWHVRPTPPSATRQARLGRSLHLEEASDAVADRAFASTASMSTPTLQTGHVPIRLSLYCMPRSLLLHAYCSCLKRPVTRPPTTHAELTTIRAPIVGE